MAQRKDGPGQEDHTPGVKETPPTRSKATVIWVAVGLVALLVLGVLLVLEAIQAA